MRIDFSPIRQLDPTGGGKGGFFSASDPISAGVGALETLYGIGQNLFSGRKKAERELNKQIDSSPKTAGYKSILDFYNKSLAKYNVNPYDTDVYRKAKQETDTTMASSLGALSGRGQALAGVNQLARARDTALLGAGANAEQLNRQDLNRLGQAAGMEASDRQRVFEQNEMLPFDLRTQLKAQKLVAANQRATAGVKNIHGGLQTAGSAYTKNNG